MVVLLLFENSLLYHPSRAAKEWWTQPNSVIQDIDFVDAGGTHIHAWWCPQKGADGAVLYCHGNAGNLSHRVEGIAEWKRRMKQSVLIFDYPGYGRSEGAPSEEGCYSAALAAYGWLTEQARISGDRVLIFGASLGGGVAMELASCVPHRALVLGCTFTSVPDLAQEIYPWLPARWLVRNRFDNLAKIRRHTKPVFIVHGDCDDVIPLAHGERLFAAANEPKEFFRIRGGGHFEGLGDACFAALTRFLSKNEARALAKPDSSRTH
jgi:fermentation-respiration switch protein FrsA (DUF1100 family)